MAQLLLIKHARIGVHEEDDVINIRSDSHVYDKNEFEKYKVVSIPGTVEEIEAQQRTTIPDIKHVYESDGKYYDKISVANIFDESDTEGISEFLASAPSKELWLNGIQWYELKQRPHFKTKWDGSKFVENISRVSINLTDIIIVEKKSILEIKK